MTLHHAGPFIPKKYPNKCSSLLARCQLQAMQAATVNIRRRRPGGHLAEGQHMGAHAVYHTLSPPIVFCSRAQGLPAHTAAVLDPAAATCARTELHMHPSAADAWWALYVGCLHLWACRQTGASVRAPSHTGQRTNCREQISADGCPNADIGSGIG